MISRTKVGERLGDINQDCKKHVNAILPKVQEVVYKLSGMIIVASDDIKGWKDVSKKDDKRFYLYNGLQQSSRYLLSVLDDSNDARSYRAFIFIVFHILFNKPGKEIRFDDLQRQIRIVDSRFPESSSLKPYAGSLPPIPQLNGSLYSLLQNMIKVT